VTESTIANLAVILPRVDSFEHGIFKDESGIQEVDAMNFNVPEPLFLGPLEQSQL